MTRSGRWLSWLSSGIMGAGFGLGLVVGVEYSKPLPPWLLEQHFLALSICAAGAVLIPPKPKRGSWRAREIAFVIGIVSGVMLGVLLAERELDMRLVFAPPVVALGAVGLVRGLRKFRQEPRT